jgi:hypothetical protein
MSYTDPNHKKSYPRPLPPIKDVNIEAHKNEIEAAARHQEPEQWGGGHFEEGNPNAYGSVGPKHNEPGQGYGHHQPKQPHELGNNPFCLF